MEKKWVIKPRGEKEQIEALAKQLNIHPILVNLLVQRGHSTYEKAKEFFRPELKMLHDPYLMKDMEKAIAGLTRQLPAKKKSWCSVIMMWMAQPLLRWYIPF
jgi:single-stranded-DNA-specific exonuclease